MLFIFRFSVHKTSNIIYLEEEIALSTCSGCRYFRPIHGKTSAYVELHPRSNDTTKTIVENALVSTSLR